MRIYNEYGQTQGGPKYAFLHEKSNAISAIVKELIEHGYDPRDLESYIGVSISLAVNGHALRSVRHTIPGEFNHG
jgi:hypothetical protein